MNAASGDGERDFGAEARVVLTAIRHSPGNPWSRIEPLLTRGRWQAPPSSSSAASPAALDDGAARLPAAIGQPWPGRPPLRPRAARRVGRVLPHAARRRAARPARRRVAAASCSPSPSRSAATRPRRPRSAKARAAALEQAAARVGTSLAAVPKGDVADGGPVSAAILQYDKLLAGWRERGQSERADARASSAAGCSSGGSPRRRGCRWRRRPSSPTTSPSRSATCSPSRSRRLHGPAVGLRVAGAAGVIDLIAKWKAEHGGAVGGASQPSQGASAGGSGGGAGDGGVAARDGAAAGQLPAGAVGAGEGAEARQGRRAAEEAELGGVARALPERRDARDDRALAGGRQGDPDGDRDRPPARRPHPGAVARPPPAGEAAPPPDEEPGTRSRRRRRRS